jgi:hypothetical protein
MITDPAKAMESQFWFARRLKDSGVTIYFRGATDIPQCWEIIRTAIVNFHLGDKLTHKGALETYSQSFERATGQPLVPAKQGSAA